MVATKIKPKALQTGDTIRVVSPASPVKKEKLEAGLQHYIGPGYKFEFGAHHLDAERYLGGTDAARARDLMDAFTDPNVSAVLCSRGGYGCARLIEHLDFAKMAASGKMFLGFSDITSLHIPLNQHGLVTFHAPMPLTMSSPRAPWVYESLLGNLAGDNAIPVSAPAGRTVMGGVAEGELIGGCLCLLTDLLGTPYQPDYSGKILLIEDVDESPHRVDAMLTALRNSGSLTDLAGIVFGEVTRCKERDTEGIGDADWREIVIDRLSYLNVPLITDFPFGHAANMLTLPLGIGVRLDADAGTITYLESACC